MIAGKCEIKRGRIDTTLSTSTLSALTGAIKQGAEDMVSAGMKPVVCVAQEIRPIVAMIVREQDVRMSVLGSREIVGTFVESVGEISADQLDVDAIAA